MAHLMTRELAMLAMNALSVALFVITLGSALGLDALIVALDVITFGSSPRACISASSTNAR